MYIVSDEIEWRGLLIINCHLSFHFQVTVLTKDHDPEDRNERDRVLKERGVIVWTSLGR